MTLEQITKRAQQQADVEGRTLAVLNLNTVGASLYVIRDYKGPEAYANEGPRFVAAVCVPQA